MPVKGMIRVTPPTMMKVWKASVLASPAARSLLNPSSRARAAFNPRLTSTT